MTDVTEREANWVEILQKAFRLILDLPGDSCLFPYEVVFGRHRPLAGVPYPPLREAPDAQAFFDEAERRHRKVAQALDEEHRKCAEKANKRRRDPPALVVGAKVWYKPERQPGTDKLVPSVEGPRSCEKASWGTFLHR